MLTLKTDVNRAISIRFIGHHVEGFITNTQKKIDAKGDKSLEVLAPFIEDLKTSLDNVSKSAQMLGEMTDLDELLLYSKLASLEAEYKELIRNFYMAIRKHENLDPEFFSELKDNVLQRMSDSFVEIAKQNMIKKNNTIDEITKTDTALNKWGQAFRETDRWSIKAFTEYMTPDVRKRAVNQVKLFGDENVENLKESFCEGTRDYVGDELYQDMVKVLRQKCVPNEDLDVAISNVPAVVKQALDSPSFRKWLSNLFDSVYEQRLEL